MTKEEYIKIRGNINKVVSTYFKIIEPDKTLQEIKRVIHRVDPTMILDILDSHFECMLVQIEDKENNKNYITIKVL